MSGTDPQDYYGPNTTYTNFASGDGLTVNFAPAVAACGGSSYFSLEGTPAVFTVTTGTPEPATFALLGGGLGSMLLMRKRLFGRS